MYVYIKNEEGFYTSGFFTPAGQWATDSDHDLKELAAARVNYLNGGDGFTPLQKAALMIAQGMLSGPHSFEGKDSKLLDSISRHAVSIAKAVIEEANK